MQHTHRFQVAAPVQTVFDAFSHLEQLAPCFPGATLERHGDDQLTGTLAVKVGPVPLHYTGTGTYLERNASRHRVVVQARGEDDRGLGGAAAVVTTELDGRGGTTEVTVRVELDLTGTPSRYGTAVADDAVAKLFDQFSSCLAVRLAAAPDASADGAQPVPPTPALPRPVPVAGLALLPVLRRYGPAAAALGALTGLALYLLRRPAGAGGRPGRHRR
jgi:carbon monoxide dehydrogenase subunit G